MERQTRNTFEVKNCQAKEFFLRFCFASQHSENKVALLERQTRSASVNSGGTLCAQWITPSPRYSGEREGVRGLFRRVRSLIPRRPLTPTLSPDYGGEGARQTNPKSNWAACAVSQNVPKCLTLAERLN